MRIVLIVACAAAFVFSAWSNLPSSANVGQPNGTIDPGSLVATTTHLPAQQFDAY